MDEPECFFDGCGSITKQPMATANQCTVKDMVGEKVDGCKFETSHFRYMKLTYNRAHKPTG